MPYYYLFIAVIIAWILVGMELSYLYLIHYISFDKINARIQHEKDILNEREQKRQEKSRSEIQKWTVDNIVILPDIASIIISMITEPPKELSTFQLKQIKSKMEKRNNVLKYSILIYPLCRIICNFTNFILIMMRYSKWNNNHRNLSNWDKYCAFIISLLYLPYNWQ